MVDHRPLSIKAGRHIKSDRLTYSVSDYIGKGGSGIVYKATCIETNSEVAVKFFLPLYDLNFELFEHSGTQQRAFAESEDFHRRELECLRQVNHPYIVRVLDHGSYSPLKSELVKQLHSLSEIKFFVMEFVDGDNLKVALQSEGIGQSDVVSILLKACEALMYLHEQKEYLHTDIRYSNILVRKGTADPVIIDFALYKNLCFDEVDAGEITKLLGDWDLIPKDIRTDHPLKQFKETSGSRQELKKICFPGLDLFQFGKLLKALEPEVRARLSKEDADYLDILVASLLDWQSVTTLSARTVRDQISKLQPTYAQFMGVEELVPASSATKTYQLPGRQIATSPLIDKIVNTRSFRRLRSINQLALVDVLYPAAGYKRHVHCLRAYAYCADLLESLTHTAQFRAFFNPRLARQTLVVALLHDINHFPFLHTFQEVRGEYVSGIDLIDLFCDGKATQDAPGIYDIVGETGLTSEQFKDLLMLDHSKFVEKGYEPGLQIARSIVDSGADIDKLAYLEDDSRFTGVAYGWGIDAARLLASATVVEVPEGIGWHLGFREQGLSAVESLVMARYWMFRNVYWHRVNRAMMAMMMHVIKKLYSEGRGNASDFIADTMWQSEESVLEYLNAKHHARFGTDCIARFILRNPASVYQRLFSISGAASVERERRLYTDITGLDAQALETFRTNATSALSDFLRVQSLNDALGFEDVLLDIPGRRLDMSGEIFIRLDSGEVKRIQDLPGPVARLTGEFEQLVKRLRVFVHPRIAEKIGQQALHSRRAEMVKLLEDAIPKRGTASQIR
jgi:HD superfamily phosphohydrolase/serine/threonine protein kinase